MLISYPLENARDAGQHHGVEIDIAAVGARLREARERRGYGSAELDIMAEVGRGTVSRIESGDRPEVSAVVLAKIADAVGVRLDWLIYGRGEMRVKDADRVAPAPDPPIGGFLLQVDRLPGLRRWIEQQREQFPLSTIARGLEAYENSPPQSREDGVPKAGWSSFFADVEADKSHELPNSHQKASQLVKRQVGRRPRLKK